MKVEFCIEVDLGGKYEPFFKADDMEMWPTVGLQVFSGSQRSPVSELAYDIRTQTVMVLLKRATVHSEKERDELVASLKKEHWWNTDQKKNQ